MTSTTPPPAAETDDVGLRAQAAAEAHLLAIWEAEDAADEGREVNSPAYGPFDGCDTCVTREVLYAALPVFEDDAISRLRAAGFADAAALLEADRFRP